MATTESSEQEALPQEVHEDPLPSNDPFESSATDFLDVDSNGASEISPGGAGGDLSQLDTSNANVKSYTPEMEQPVHISAEFENSAHLQDNSEQLTNDITEFNFAESISGEKTNASYEDTHEFSNHTLESSSPHAMALIPPEGDYMGDHVLDVSVESSAGGLPLLDDGASGGGMEPSGVSSINGAVASSSTESESKNTSATTPIPSSSQGDTLLTSLVGGSASLLASPPLSSTSVPAAGSAPSAIPTSSSSQPPTSAPSQPNAYQKKMMDRYNGLSEEEVIKKQLPDYLQENLDMVVIGINPSLASANTGHHYAGCGNHFWECLYESGIVPHPVTCYDDAKMLDYGIGFTNFCTRPTKGTAELTRRELKRGIEILMKKIIHYKPKIAVFNGKGIYAAYMGHKNFNIGKQPEPLPGTNSLIFVMPSSSARCAQLPQVADKLPFFSALRKLRDWVRGDLQELHEEELIFTDYADLRVSQPDPKSLLKAERRRKRIAEQMRQHMGVGYVPQLGAPPAKRAASSQQGNSRANHAHPSQSASSNVLPLPGNTSTASLATGNNPSSQQLVKIKPQINQHSGLPSTHTQAMSGASLSARGTGNAVSASGLLGNGGVSAQQQNIAAAAAQNPVAAAAALSAATAPHLHQPQTIYVTHAQGAGAGGVAELPLQILTQLPQSQLLNAGTQLIQLSGPGGTQHLLMSAPPPPGNSRILYPPAGVPGPSSSSTTALTVNQLLPATNAANNAPHHHHHQQQQQQSVAANPTFLYDQNLGMIQIDANQLSQLLSQNSGHTHPHQHQHGATVTSTASVLSTGPNVISSPGGATAYIINMPPHHQQQNQVTSQAQSQAQTQSLPSQTAHHHQQVYAITQSPGHQQQQPHQILLTTSTGGTVPVAFNAATAPLFNSLISSTAPSLGDEHGQVSQQSLILAAPTATQAGGGMGGTTAYIIAGDVNGQRMSFPLLQSEEEHREVVRQLGTSSNVDELGGTSYLTYHLGNATTSTTGNGSTHGGNAGGATGSGSNLVVPVSAATAMQAVSSSGVGGQPIFITCPGVFPQDLPLAQHILKMDALGDGSGATLVSGMDVKSGSGMLGNMLLGMKVEENMIYTS